MDFFDQLGELALGSRLKRLSDNIMKDGGRIYADNNLSFEPKYFPIFYLLKNESPLSITEIADQLGISHPSVIQMVNEMVRKKMLISQKDRYDKRKRLISLSEQSKKMTAELELVWQDIAQGIHGLLEAQSTNIMNAINELERNLSISCLADRVSIISKKRKLDEIEIVEYKDEYSEIFKQINYQWIQQYFKVEEIDRKYLENHKKYIIDQGGAILFASYQNKIAGTCSLIKTGEYEFELSKMGVLDEYRGKQIGKKLGIACIEKARSLGARKIFLYSNKKLTPAIRLYESMGFVHVNRGGNQSAYQRSNVYMELTIKETLLTHE